jgi:hypothetical protein
MMTVINSEEVFDDEVVAKALEASGFSAEETECIIGVFFHGRLATFHRVSGNPVIAEQARVLILIAVDEFIADELRSERRVSELRRLDKFAIDFEKRVLA